jgi:hypothetical protein
MATSDSEQHIAGMKAPTTAFRPDSAGADHNRDWLQRARRYPWVITIPDHMRERMKLSSDQTSSIENP